MFPIVFALVTQTQIALAPWRGADLPSSPAVAAKYRMTVTAKPGEIVRLRASGISKGWIGAFCDTSVCSPNSVRETIPRGGRVVLQFELIREDENASRSSGAVITSDDGAIARIARAAV